MRSILEDTLLHLMYEIPSMTDVSKVVIDEKVILKNAEPVFVYGNASTKRKHLRNNINILYKVNSISRIQINYFIILMQTIVLNLS